MCYVGNIHRECGLCYISLELSWGQRAEVSMRFQSRGGSRESIAGRFWFTGRNPFVTVGEGELGSPWGLSAEGVCTGLWLREVSPR